VQIHTHKGNWSVLCSDFSAEHLDLFFLDVPVRIILFFRQDYSLLCQKRNSNPVLWLLKFFASLDEIQMVVWTEQKDKISEKFKGNALIFI